MSNNISSAKSRIADADIALETANLAKSKVIQQGGIAMVAQGNLYSKQVLALLDNLPIGAMK